MTPPRWTLLLALPLAGCKEAPPAQSVPSVEIAAPAPTAAPAATASAEPDPECIPVRPKKKGEAPPVKREVADQLLKGQSVMFHLDARRPGVVVPDYLAKDPRLVLQVGYVTAPPIPDLKVDAKGFSGTLSFKHQPFFVKVPWAAVWAAQGAKDKKGFMWEDDIPADQLCP